jgi:hypothetical protein
VLHSIFIIHHRLHDIDYTGFQVVTSLATKSEVFWVVTLCSSEIVLRLEWKYLLNLQGREGSQARKQPEVGSKQNTLPLAFLWFLSWLTLRHWRWMWYVPPKWWPSASAGFLLGLLFKPKNWGNIIPRNVGFSPNYTALQPRIPYNIFLLSGFILLWRGGHHHHSWSWALLEKLTIVQLLENFPAFYGTRRFITAFT